MIEKIILSITFLFQQSFLIKSDTISLYMSKYPIILLLLSSIMVFDAYRFRRSEKYLCFPHLYIHLWKSPILQLPVAVIHHSPPPQYPMSLLSRNPIPWTSKMGYFSSEHIRNAPYSLLYLLNFPAGYFRPVIFSYAPATCPILENGTPLGIGLLFFAPMPNFFKKAGYSNHKRAFDRKFLQAKTSW